MGRAAMDGIAKMKKVFGVDIFTMAVVAIILTLLSYHLYQYFKFRDTISAYIQHTNESLSFPHLTIYDGQALCERIAALEKEPKPCEYIQQ